MTQAELIEFLELFRALPAHKRALFTKQMHLLSEGKPNAIEGTAPLPIWWSEQEADTAA